MGVEYLESVGTGPCETHDKDTIGHLVDSGQWYIIWKSRGGIMVNGVPREVPRHSIHHDTPNAFPYNVILSASRTSKEGFLSLAPNPTCA